jgi:hypothetical protein
VYVCFSLRFPLLLLSPCFFPLSFRGPHFPFFCFLSSKDSLVFVGVCLTKTKTNLRRRKTLPRRLPLLPRQTAAATGSDAAADKQPPAEPDITHLTPPDWTGAAADAALPLRAGETLTFRGLGLRARNTGRGRGTGTGIYSTPSPGEHILSNPYLPGAEAQVDAALVQAFDTKWEDFTPAQQEERFENLTLLLRRRMGLQDIGSAEDQLLQGIPLNKIMETLQGRVGGDPDVSEYVVQNLAPYIAVPQPDSSQNSGAHTAQDATAAEAQASQAAGPSAAKPPSGRSQRGPNPAATPAFRTPFTSRPQPSGPGGFTHFHAMGKAQPRRFQAPPPGASPFQARMPQPQAQMPQPHLRMPQPQAAAQQSAPQPSAAPQGAAAATAPAPNPFQPTQPAANNTDILGQLAQLMRAANRAGDDEDRRAGRLPSSFLKGVTVNPFTGESGQYFAEWLEAFEMHLEANRILPIDYARALRAYVKGSAARRVSRLPLAVREDYDLLCDALRVEYDSPSEQVRQNNLALLVQGTKEPALEFVRRVQDQVDLVFVTTDARTREMLAVGQVVKGIQREYIRKVPAIAMARTVEELRFHLLTHETAGKLSTVGTELEELPAESNKPKKGKRGEGHTYAINSLLTDLAAANASETTRSTQATGPSRRGVLTLSKEDSEEIQKMIKADHSDLATVISNVQTEVGDQLKSLTTSSPSAGGGTDGESPRLQGR